MVNFAESQYLFGLLLLPVLFLFWFWTFRRRQRDLAALGSPDLVGILSSSVNRRGRFWKALLSLIVYTLLIVSLARPRWGSTVQRIETQGIQIIIALDVSPSMLAEDVKPSRLSRAKLEAVDLLNRLGGDEVGLVLFSGSAYLQFPLTNDYGTARSFIETAAPEVISRPGTAIGEAVRIAARSFNPKRAAQKVILILSDGEDHAADTMESVRQAAEQGIRIDAIGFGTPQGAPVPQFDENGQVSGYLKDSQGEVVISKMDENDLQQISAQGKGAYWRAGSSGTELALILADWGRLEKGSGDSQFERLPIERFQVFLLPSLILMVLIEIIPDRKRKARHESTGVKSVSLLLLVPLFAMLASGCTVSPQRLNNEGNRHFMNGDYDKALQNYQQTQASLPDAPEPYYNEGNTHYRRGAFDQAAQVFQNSLEKARDTVAEQAFYNLGNAYYQAAAWDKAAEAYRNALRILPDDQDAKVNLELALQKKAEEERKKTQPQEKPEQQKQDQQKEQQQPPPGATPSPQTPSQAQTTPDAQATSQPAPAEGMSAEEARRLLEAAAQDTQNLQQYLQRLQPTAQSRTDEAW